MPVSVAVTIPRSAAHVGVARDLVAAGLRNFAAREAVVDEMRLVVSEAAGNVVRHAAGCDEYTVTFDLDVGICEVSVSCLGEEFQPTSAMPEPHAQGGRGVALMAALTDSLTVAHESGRTTVLLIRRW